MVELAARVGVHGSTVHRWVVRYMTGQLPVYDRAAGRVGEPVAQVGVVSTSGRGRGRGRGGEMRREIPTGREHRASRPRYGPHAGSALLLCPRSVSVFYQQLV